MAKSRSNGEPGTVHSFQFNLVGLILLILCVMVATAFVSKRVSDTRPKAYSFTRNVIPDPDVQDKDLFTRTGPWGELLMQNIKLERPVEYISAEVKDPESETWNFANMNLAEVKALLAGGGLTKEQVEAQVTSDRIRAEGAQLAFTPDENFLLSLTPAIRSKLYQALYGRGIETYLDYPFIFPNGTIETIYRDPRLNPEDLALLKQLVYSTDNSDRLTDYNLLMRKIPTLERRMVMSKVLSVQPAVLARLCVRPDSDIDKIAAYWGKVDNVRFMDLRPMLEALKGLPNGGTVSLMHLLPPFARTRLYTYPLPPRPGEPKLDCHWSTFNFSCAEVDNRFSDPAYGIEHLQKNYYQIDSAALYGDLVLYANENKEIKHSAVFLADDLAFTKFGDNYRQPWMIVRMADMQAFYPTLKPVFFRRKTQ